MSTTAGWAESMYKGMSINKIDNAPLPMNHPLQGVYFIFIIISCNFFLYNFFIGVVISSFDREREKLSKDYMLMENQRQWLQIKLLVLKQSPAKRISRPKKSDFRAAIYDVCTTQLFETFILTCIIINTLCMSVRWYQWEFDWLEEKVNHIFLVVFLLEVALKLIAFGLKYFSTSWNRFDFIVVVASSVSFLLTKYYPALAFGSSATIFRSIKLGRLIKLVKQNKALQVVF